MWIWYCNSDCECDCHLPLCTLWCLLYILSLSEFEQSDSSNHVVNFIITCFNTLWGKMHCARSLALYLSLSLFRFRIPVVRLNGMRVCAFKCVINGFYIAFVWWNSHFDRNRIGNHVKSAVFDKRTHTHDYEYMHLYIYVDPFTC